MERLVLRSFFARTRVHRIDVSCYNKISARLFSTPSSSVEDVCESRRPVFKPILMTGIQPTGIPHIGNYFGSIKQCKELQDSNKFDKLFVCIADLHSITVPQNPQTLRENIMNTACALLACGLDRPNTVLFQQSSVPQHAELSWILGCLTTMNKLDHLPQWKEKIKDNQEVPLGLYVYPVLQAADILMYKATEVPIGDDQVKHMELARYLAKLFNRKYKQVFPLPKNILGSHVRIKSLRDPLRKMSKSEKDSRGRIELLDSPDEVREKLKKAVTDTGHGVMVGYDADGRPGISNLIDIYAAFQGSTPDQICSDCSALDTREFKERVAECIIEKMKPMRAKIVQYRNSPEHVLTVLERGADLARQAARETCSEVKQLVGFSQ